MMAELSRWEWMTEEDENGERRGISIPPTPAGYGWLLGGWELNPKFEGHIKRSAN